MINTLVSDVLILVSGWVYKNGVVVSFFFFVVHVDSK